MYFTRDINTMTPKTQLIAHDKEVFDLAFACGKVLKQRIKNRSCPAVLL
jgi:hypothetical protein